MAPERLRALREAHDLSLRALATIVEMTPQYLSMVETGKKRASAKLLNKLATYYRVDRSVFGRPCRPRSAAEVPQS